MATVTYSKYYIRQMMASEVDEFSSAYSPDNELILVFEGKEYKNDINSTNFTTDYGYAYFDIEPNTQDTQEKGPLKIGGISTSHSLVFWLENQDYKESHPTAQIGLYAVASKCQNPSGQILIESNGVYDVAKYASAAVDVPLPNGTITISTNGTHNVRDYENAVVNVNTKISTSHIGIGISDHNNEIFLPNSFRVTYYTQSGQRIQKNTPEFYPNVAASSNLIDLPIGSDGKIYGFVEAIISTAANKQNFTYVKVVVKGSNPSDPEIDITQQNTSASSIGNAAYWWEGDQQRAHYILDLHGVPASSTITFMPRVL